jgi:hypothetical protein
MIQWLCAGGEARAFYIPFSSIVLWMTPRTADTSGFLRHLNFFLFIHGKDAAAAAAAHKSQGLETPGRTQTLRGCFFCPLSFLFFLIVSLSADSTVYVSDESAAKRI